MRMLSRRHFARQLGAAAFLLPFLPARLAPAAASAKRRLIIVWSLSTNIDYWRPTSAPGAPIAWGDSTAPLAEIADKVVLVDGLTPAEPNETHSTPQALTGVGFGGTTHVSVDQFIAGKLGLPAPLLLGVQSTSESQFMNSTRSATSFGRLPPNDSPQSAFNQLFGASVPVASPSTTSAVPRRAILDLSARQIRSLQATLGSEQKLKLEQHLDAIATLEANLDGGAKAKGCSTPMAPTLGGQNASNQAANNAVGEAHRDLIVAALSCGLTQVVGMQWGISNLEFLSGTLNYDEHSAVHTTGARTHVVAAEHYLAGWFVGLVKSLAATADPAVAGKTLLDTTVVLWTRDFGTQSPGSHINFSMPFVLAGAPDYLPVQAGGTYLNFGADNNSQTSGLRHERLLLNLCEAMGVTDTSGFGLLTGADRAPLPQLRRT